MCSEIYVIASDWGTSPVGLTKFTWKPISEHYKCSLQTSVSFCSFFWEEWVVGAFLQCSQGAAVDIRALQTTLLKCPWNDSPAACMPLEREDELQEEGKIFLSQTVYHPTSPPTHSDNSIFSLLDCVEYLLSCCRASGWVVSQCRDSDSLGKQQTKRRALSAATVRTSCQPPGLAPTLQGGRKEPVGFPAALWWSFLTPSSGRTEMFCKVRVRQGQVPETADSSWWAPPRCEVSSSGFSQWMSRQQAGDMKAGGLRLSGQLEIPEGHLQPSPSQLLSVLCTALMLSSFSISQLPLLLSNRAPHSVLITMSRAGLMNFIFFSLSFFRKPGKMSKCCTATLCRVRCPALRAPLPGLERLQCLFSAVELAG